MIFPPVSCRASSTALKPTDPSGGRTAGRNPKFFNLSNIFNSVHGVKKRNPPPERTLAETGSAERSITAFTSHPAQPVKSFKFQC
jgi:hypothetical protein